MAQFADITITRTGLDMIAKSQTGDKLIFTGIKIGDGQIGAQSIPDMTDLINFKQDVPINSVTAKENGHAEIIGIIDNENLDVGFFVREIGIFAKINDGGTPALYGYANAGNLASYISDKSIPMDAIKFKIDIVIGNSENVSFTSDKSIVYVTQENLDAHNVDKDSHPDIRQKITDDISAHNKDEAAHPFLLKKITTDISTHNTATNAHSDFDWVKTMSAASDGLHFRTRNASADTVLNLINTLQATLNQGTVPSGNNGTILALLSGIVHQIAALSGKAHWWETPKDSFETLSAGIVAGDVSNPNAWWVKFGGVVPLIIQGGRKSSIGRGTKITYPLALSQVALFGDVCPYEDAKPNQIGWTNFTLTAITFDVGLNSAGAAEGNWLVVGV